MAITIRRADICTEVGDNVRDEFGTADDGDEGIGTPQMPTIRDTGDDALLFQAYRRRHDRRVGNRTLLVDNRMNLSYRQWAAIPQDIEYLTFGWADGWGNVCECFHTTKHSITVGRCGSRNA